MQLFGIQLAPLNVSLERRLQTLASAGWFVSLGLGAAICWLIVGLLLFYGNLWIRLLCTAYFTFLYFDREARIRGGRSKKWTLWMRNNAWWRYYRDYFPIKLVKTVDLDPDRTYLFCSFPHGILASGAFAAFGTNALGCDKLFPGLDFRILTLDQHFQTPFFRELVYSFGACSVDARSIDYLITTKPGEGDGPTSEVPQGRAIVLIVGGASESFKCKPGTYRIILSRRKGFIRMAMKHGIPLVPVMSFGETDLYDQMNNPEGSLVRKFQEFFKDLTGIAPIIPIGRGFFQYSFGLLPHRKPVTVVVGAPLEVPKINDPTQGQVKDYHEKFTEKLIELFEKEKRHYIQNHENVSLILE